jgi:hypothetical protein
VAQMGVPFISGHSYYPESCFDSPTNGRAGVHLRHTRQGRRQVSSSRRCQHENFVCRQARVALSPVNISILTFSLQPPDLIISVGPCTAMTSIRILASPGVCFGLVYASQKVRLRRAALTAAPVLTRRYSWRISLPSYA